MDERGPVAEPAAGHPADNLALHTDGLLASATDAVVSTRQASRALVRPSLLAQRPRPMKSSLSSFTANQPA
jgi:hypothetical protein